MEINRLGPSMTELVLSDGGRILFSYETPVAAEIGSVRGAGVFPPGSLLRSDKFFSRTTTAHLSKWLKGRTVRAVPHDVILKLTKEAR